MANESLCWTCSRCRGDRCGWVAFGERVWKSARKGVVRNGIQLYVVENCAYYDGPGLTYDPRDVERALELVVDGGLTQAQAAKRQGVSVHTLRGNLYRAINNGKIIRIQPGEYAWAE